MNILALVGGVFAGIMIFSAHEPILNGALFGGALAILLDRVLALKGRVSSLEEQLQELWKRFDAATARPAVRPPAPVAVPRTAPVAPPPAAPAPARVRTSEALPELKIELEPQAGRSAGLAAQSTQSPDPAAPARPAPIAASSASPPNRPQPAPAGATRAVPPAKPPLELWDIALGYFTGGNVVVRMGMLVLFFGVAFLLKYSIDKNLLPIEYRLAAITLGGIGLLVCGWRLRQSRQVYALILQGGGVGILYLTAFGALKLYHLLPIGLALALMVALSAGSAALAIIQDARALAVIGITGGFLAPVLTSTGSGSHVMLFSYYALLNAGILGTAWYKSWRELNLLGFLFTFAVGGGLWGYRSYQPELFATTEPFLLLFFFFYLAIGVLFARNQPLAHKGYIDCTMVFGTPLVAFALQAAMVKEFEYGLAWSALALGLTYAGLAWLVFWKGNTAMRTLTESFLALGVVFGTVAIPLALDGRWTSAAWALEGNAIVWVAIRQQRTLARHFGLLLQLLAGVAFIAAVHEPSDPTPLINGLFLGALCIALAAFFSSACLHRQEGKIPEAAQESLMALAWGLLWWFGSGLHEIHRFVPRDLQLAVSLGYLSLSGLTAFAAGVGLNWRGLRLVSRGLPTVLVGGAFYSLVTFHSHPAIHSGWLAWPLAVLLNYFLLYRDEQEDASPLLPPLHLLAFLTLIGLVSWESWWWIAELIRGSGVWALAVLGVVPALFIFAACRFRDSLAWPLGAHPRIYLYHGLIPVVVFLWLGSLYLNLTSTGDMTPLLYLPLLNPLDLAQVLVLLALIYWALVIHGHEELSQLGPSPKGVAIAAGATTFVWLNGVLFRTLHYWAKIPFHPKDMVASDLAQTSVSIFWTVSAFGVMYWSNQAGRKLVWLVGAGLIGVVVVKLFMFDLAHTDTVERIVSFIGVGALCLVIGFLAPMPQEATEESAPE